MVPVMGRPRVLLGDSSRAVLVFMEILLEPHFQVLGIVTDGEALVQAAKGLNPDLVIIDFSLSFLDGLGGARQLHELMPDIKVVFFTTHHDPSYAKAAFEVGAAGYLVKQYTGDLKHFLERIMRGQRVLHPEQLSTLTNAAGTDVCPADE